MIYDVCFVEDDWESLMLGVWGFGWEVWCDGMEVSQFIYFQQVGGYDCCFVLGELIYGFEWLVMYVLGVEYVMDMFFNYFDSLILLIYGDIFNQMECEYFCWNFDVVDIDMLLQYFKDVEVECDRILFVVEIDVVGWVIFMVYFVYDQVIKVSYLFNLLDVCGVIFVIEWQVYIGCVWVLVKCCVDLFVMIFVVIGVLLFVFLVGV